jgi:hypothetical protein
MAENNIRCRQCKVAMYCSKRHREAQVGARGQVQGAVLVSLGTFELTRICDHPGCQYMAENNIRCRQCKVAMYFSKRHREKHKSAHESRCKELCLYR